LADEHLELALMDPFAALVVFILVCFAFLGYAAVTRRIG
jgi:hypothetical protein